MDITTILFNLKIRTYVMDVITVLPSPASIKFEVGKNLPETIGFIYGLSTYADGTDPDGNTLISTTQAQNIYLTLQTGATQFLEQVRLSDLLNEFAGSPVVRPNKYTPVNLPIFDLSKSFYQNPVGYTGTEIAIRLKIWYIEITDWNNYLKTQK